MTAMTEARFHSEWIPLQDRFYRVAYHILEDRCEAEDVVQDLYVKLWEMRDLLDMVKNPAAYGILLTRNLCIDRIRKQRPTTTPDDSLPGDGPPDNDLISKEIVAEVLQAIEGLPPGQKKVIRMRIFEGKSNSAIAALTGMSELNIRVQMSLARNRIKKRLKDEKYR